MTSKTFDGFKSSLDREAKEAERQRLFASAKKAEQKFARTLERAAQIHAVSMSFEEITFLRSFAQKGSVEVDDTKRAGFEQLLARGVFEKTLFDLEGRTLSLSALGAKVIDVLWPKEPSVIFDARNARMETEREELRQITARRAERKADEQRNVESEPDDR